MGGRKSSSSGKAERGRFRAVGRGLRAVPRTWRAAPGRAQPRTLLSPLPPPPHAALRPAAAGSSPPGAALRPAAPLSWRPLAAAAARCGGSGSVPERRGPRNFSRPEPRDAETPPRAASITGPSPKRRFGPASNPNPAAQNCLNNAANRRRVLKDCRENAEQHAAHPKGTELGDVLHLIPLPSRGSGSSARSSFSTSQNKVLLIKGSSQRSRRSSSHGTLLNKHADSCWE